MSMQEVENQYAEMLQACKTLSSAIGSEDPFKALNALSEMNKAVKRAMMEAIEAQEEMTKGRAA